MRIALTEEQVEEYDLPTAPAKEDDPRTKTWEGSGTCQLEAMPPDIIAEILQDELESLFDPEQLERDQEAEEIERRSITRAPRYPKGDE